MTTKKIAIVTGGNRGIGHEIARQLIKADLFVVVGARDKAKCDIAL
jgi:NAD(P)-dependent dehydrogenase (short-subunit alcohol dehydrogenase family)